MAMTVSAPEVSQRISALKYPSQAIIAGRLVAAQSGRTLPCLNPATGERLTEIPACDASDVDAAVRAARAAFDAGVWRHESPQRKRAVLVRLAELMQRHALELALLETQDVGKPISESIMVDVPLSIECVRWYGEALDKIHDELAVTGHDAVGMVVREPLGVIGVVVPWNYPLLMAVWKVAPALAMGNSVVLKPAELASLTALRLGELALEAGLPPGVLNVVPGTGESAGRAIGLHPDIDAVAFTGSTEVGKAFLQYSAQSNMKRVSLECGGKSPNIVLADCHDLDVAARAAADAIFFNQGEVCTAGSRLIVEESVKEALLEKVVASAGRYVPGDPLDPRTTLGPLITREHYERVISFIRSGETEGARLVLGGRRAAPEAKGHYLEPTIFDGVKSTMQIAREEIFGPVLSTLSAASADDAIDIANRTAYGLAAALWTRDVNRAHRFARRLQSGMVWINCYSPPMPMNVPFGGVKQSGFGRDKSLHALDKYCDLKLIWLQLH